jgi:hypothetical protein
MTCRKSYSAVVTLEFEVNGFGELDLVDCYDKFGKRSEGGCIEEEGCWSFGRQLTDVDWVWEEWGNSGLDMLPDDLQQSTRLVIKGCVYSEGPLNWYNEYDSGFEVTEIIEQIP